jgi:RNA polymerase sigma-70 factor (ECF subfamily)
VDLAHSCDCDEELMMQAKRGDQRAFDLLFRQHRAPVQRFVFRMVRDRTEAEDITQEVFLRVYRYRDGYEVTAKFTTWLYRIAGHVTLNWIRDHSRSRYSEPLEPPAGSRPRRHFVDGTVRIDEWLLFQSRMAALRSAMDELPARQRQIVRLHKFEEMGCEEIASALGCSNQAVRSTLCRAYGKLREMLSADADQGARPINQTGSAR